LCGRETWPPTLREEYNFRGFENRVLGRISGPKKGRRKLYIGEIHNVYSSPNIIRGKKIREVKKGGTCSKHGEPEK
jgi:hypothetical protein